MNISIVSGQIAKVHVKLETEERFELYGGTDRASFDIDEERLNEYVVTVREEVVAGKPLSRYNVYVRQSSSGREWVVLSGKLLVSPRTADISADKLAPVEYKVTIPVVDNVVDLTGMAIVTGIIGPRGWSAYEIAVQEGFEGTESEWLEHMRQQTATLAVEQVTPLMERAETAADKSEREAAAAKTEQETAAAHAAAAKESELAADEHKTDAAAETQKAKTEARQASIAKNAAANSAQDALANQQGAERAAQDAAQAQVAAETAKADADAAKLAAQTSERNAKASADAAATDKAAAEQAKNDALAAQTTAEEQAAIATKAAEDAQSPESIAAQSARPATMLLLKDELLSLLGDASLFDIDTDGQKIIVHTDRLTDDNLSAVTDMLERFVPQFIEVVQYNHNIEVSWKDINKYAECTTAKEMYLVDPNKNFFDAKLGYQTVDVCSDGSFVYPNKLKSTDSESSNYGSNLFSTAMASHALFSGSFPEMTGWSGVGAGCTELILDAPKLKIFVEIYSNKLKTIKCNSEEITNATHLLWGANVENVECVFPKLSTARFTTNAKLNKESVLRIINSLTSFSTGTHVLQLGIHIDHQNDEEVLAALDAATAKGWTVSRQWNGTATAATFALRRAQPLPVYAKLYTYTDAEGNEWPLLDWCHQVTSPDGKTPEELGYMLFESEEAAREYFGLPAEEEVSF